MKVAVVLGASGAIGAAIAEALAQEGFALVLVGREMGRLQETLRRCYTPDSRVEALAGDLSEEEVYHRILRLGGQLGESLRVLAYAAGEVAASPVHEMPLPSWRGLVESQLTGLFLTAKHLLPRMEPGGWFFVVTSIAAEEAFPGWAAYCAVKAGQSMFLRVLREEYREFGVRIVELQPGATRSRIWEHIPGSWDLERMLEPAAIAEMVRCILRREDAWIPLVRVVPPGGRL